MDLIISIENKDTRFNDAHNIEIVNNLEIERLILECDSDKKNSIWIACEYKLDNVLLAILQKCNNYLHFIFNQTCLICKDNTYCNHENIFYLIIKFNLINSFRYITNSYNIQHILKFINVEHYEQYPIHEACINMNLEILNFLVKHKSVININNNRIQPLHMCALFRFYEGIYLLINNGANIHLRDYRYGQNLLHIMCRETVSCQEYDYDQDNYIIDYLLRNNVDENKEDNYDLIPYSYAYIYGKEDLRWKEKCNIFINTKVNILKNNYYTTIKNNIDINLFKNIVDFIYQKS